MSGEAKPSPLDILSPLHSMIGYDRHKIDSAIFRWHAKYTVIFLVTSSLLITAGQFFGDPIDCLVDEAINPAVMDTYCWIHSTFTFPKRLEDPATGVVAHPGVGPAHVTRDEDTGEIVVEEQMVHKYYQWVCFTLFFQAMLFYLPRWIWMSWEGNRVRTAISEDLVYSVDDARMPAFGKPLETIADDVCETAELPL